MVASLKCVVVVPGVGEAAVELKLDAAFDRQTEPVLSRAPASAAFPDTPICALASASA
jgi:hypothetical protein